MAKTRTLAHSMAIGKQLLFDQSTTKKYKNVAFILPRTSELYDGQVSINGKLFNFKSFEFITFNQPVQTSSLNRLNYSRLNYSPRHEIKLTLEGKRLALNYKLNEMFTQSEFKYRHAGTEYHFWGQIREISAYCTTTQTVTLTLSINENQIIIEGGLM